MRVPLRMNLSNSANQLPKNRPALVFRHSLVWQFFQVVVNGHARAQLHHEVDVCALVYNFVQAHNVWMAQVG